MRSHAQHVALFATDGSGSQERAHVPPTADRQADSYRDRRAANATAPHQDHDRPRNKREKIRLGEQRHAERRAEPDAGPGKAERHHHRAHGDRHRLIAHLARRNEQLRDQCDHHCRAHRCAIVTQHAPCREERARHHDGCHQRRQAAKHPGLGRQIPFPDQAVQGRHQPVIKRRLLRLPQRHGRIDFECPRGRQRA